uniref:Uncharacterized protein LOC104247203 n=1 Tax=Nicotiana sylvestris TaxID=4096 RepID=A0A1U7YEB2_NICSY|nr:PREDICTED: uncharacterized protein LOC104247203 [Nicotiana sylvestris]
MVHRQERGPVSDKRHCHFGGFSGASSRGRGSFSRVHPPRSFQSVLQASHDAFGSLGPCLEGGQATRGGGQAIRGGGQAIRGRCQPTRGRLSGGGQTGGAQPYFYALSVKPEAKAHDAIITGIVPVCDRDVSILFVPGSTYSYMSSCFSSYLVVPRDSLSAPVYVSTPWEILLL